MVESIGDIKEQYNKMRKKALMKGQIILWRIIYFWIFIFIPINSE